MGLFMTKIIGIRLIECEEFVMYCLVFHLF